jgi:hypothetical protein
MRQQVKEREPARRKIRVLEVRPDRTIEGYYLTQSKWPDENGLTWLSLIGDSHVAGHCGFTMFSCVGDVPTIPTRTHCAVYW